MRCVIRWWRPKRSDRVTLCPEAENVGRSLVKQACVSAEIDAIPRFGLRITPSRPPLPPTTTPGHTLDTATGTFGSRTKCPQRPKTARMASIGAGVYGNTGPPKHGTAVIKRDTHMGRLVSAHPSAVRFGHDSRKDFANLFFPLLGLSLPSPRIFRQRQPQPVVLAISPNQMHIQTPNPYRSSTTRPKPYRK
jgi:hypothetical protein